MEKLKVKHDHKLTDILKVFIFGLMLILPGLILLPSMLYYGVNEYATAPTEQVEKIEYKRVNFNQLYDYKLVNTQEVNGITFENLQNGYYHIYGTATDYADLVYPTQYDFSLAPIVVASYTDNQVICRFSSINGTYNNNLGRFELNTLTQYYLRVEPNTTLDIYFAPQIYNLTQMFGRGNEPTNAEFKNYYPNEYYEYTESKYEILEIPTGTYETYTDITSQIQFNWNSLWQQPLFSWTNYTILKQGLDNFTNVLGITQTSYINNLIAYELIMVAIYIVIDIVLTLFKWLTHLVGSKE